MNLQEAIAAAKRWGLDGVAQQSPQNGHGRLGWCGEEPKVHEQIILPALAITAPLWAKEER